MDIHERPLILEENHKEGLVIEKIDYTDGIKVYIKDHKHPFKGMPTEAAVQSINVIKKILLLQPIKAMWIAIEPHILKPEFQQPMTKELIKMFPSKIGITIAHVFEHDSAYRFFTQDLLHETTKERLLNEPWSEIHRLMAISERRLANNPDGKRKMRYVLKICLILLYLPFFRKALRNCNFTNLQPDEDDLFWISKRIDYIANA